MKALVKTRPAPGAEILTVPDPLAYDATLVSKLYGADGKVIFTKYAA